MRFIQIMEYEQDTGEALAEVQGYAEQAGDEITVGGSPCAATVTSRA